MRYFPSQLSSLLFLSLFLLNACGGGGGGDDAPSEGAGNQVDTSSTNTDTGDASNPASNPSSSNSNGASNSNETTSGEPADSETQPETPSSSETGSGSTNEPNTAPNPAQSYVFSSDSSRNEALSPPGTDNFGSGASFNLNFTGDATYRSAIQVTSGQGFGAGTHVGFIAFTGYANGFADNFDTLNFKVKANSGNLQAFEVKFFVPDNSKVYNLNAGIAEPLENGWLQVSIPMSEFAATIRQNDGFLLGPFQGQSAAFSYLLTDISFSKSAMGDGNNEGGSNTDSGTVAGDGSSAGNANPADFGITPLHHSNTVLEPDAAYVRSDGVIVTRFGDRGRDRHAKDNGSQDHYDHYLAHYWQYRTARIQLEDHTANGQSLIRATYITEEELSSREFRVWFWGVTTSAQFHLNAAPRHLGGGTWNNDFVKTSNFGNQHMYQVDIVSKWENGGQFQRTLQAGMSMEFEISQFLRSPPAGSRLNYYGTTYVYIVGQPGLAPFEWQRGVNNSGGSNDGTALPTKALSGGDTTLGYNYSAEPAGRFMQMATNLSHRNAQPFVRGRRIHHSNFVDGSHDERADNPVWNEQIAKAGNHYINHSCSGCHVRNGRALVSDVGDTLDKWVFKIADANGNPEPQRGSVLQPVLAGNGVSEGDVRLTAWTNHPNGLRSPNYVFSNGEPAKFSARIAPQIVGVGLLEAVPESVILDWADADDADGDGISGRASIVRDPVTGDSRLGRFGYKASTFSVKHQAATALNTDIGVMTNLLPEPDCGAQQANCSDSGAELTEAQLDDLSKYLSLLGVGARRNYNFTQGENLFNSIGCGDCHRPTLATGEFHPLAELREQTIHPYTDLLLHDMGDGLADNLVEGSASGSEWRTAPLWGLGHARSVMLGDAKANDSVSLAGRSSDVNRIGYLHDGRARTIDEAIRWHGGEAQAANDAYQALSSSNRQQLLNFLNDL